MNPEEDERITAWHEIAAHPFFKPCYDTDGTLIGAMLERLDTLDRAIIIDRADLPEVKHAEGIGLYTDDAAGWKRSDESDADYNRRRALHHLALAEHLDAQPPVDPEQVAALAGLVTEALGESRTTQGFITAGEDIARRLVERGVRVETEAK